MANLYQKPKRVEYSMPYKGSDEERINVTYSENQADIRIETMGSILIDKLDLEWLIDVLRDIRTLRDEELKNADK